MGALEPTRLAVEFLTMTLTAESMAPYPEEDQAESSAGAEESPLPMRVRRVGLRS